MLKECPDWNPVFLICVSCKQAMYCPVLMLACAGLQQLPKNRKKKSLRDCLTSVIGIVAFGTPLSFVVILALGAYSTRQELGVRQSYQSVDESHRVLKMVNLVDYTYFKPQCVV